MRAVNRHRRARALALVTAGTGATLLLSGCGVAAKQANEKTIATATAAVLRSPQVTGLLSVVSYPLKPHRPAPPGSNRVGYFATGVVPVLIDGVDGRAAVASGGDGGTTKLIFTNDWMYQRRPANPSASASGLLASAGAAPSNLPLLAAPPPIPGVSSTATSVANASSNASVANSSLSEVSGSATTNYQAVSAQSRPWIALDYAALSARDRTKTAGSLGISPLLVLRLGQGALTGSVEPLSEDHSRNQADVGLRQLEGVGYRVYKVNFSLDKAEKGLSDHQKQVIARVMTANAVLGGVFPGALWLNRDGSLAGLSVVFPQIIDTNNASLLFVTLALAGSGQSGRAATIASSAALTTTPPGVNQTVSVANLGDLVHEVAP